ncbi:4-diphosphocytidyl-2C-methyl-D-erythritol kinase [Pseudoxanthomonas winnipegensis]|nr:4-diphosphocytidyl-2C-methyl-D-erythritol kinase [Pseudoxanthomonas winnipegensis]
MVRISASKSAFRPAVASAAVSSDAATVLRVLDHLWGTALGEDALAALGLTLGADVPIFVRGRNAWAEGVGERLTPIALPPAWYVLVDPGLHVATPVLFASPDLTRNAAPVKIADFLSGSVPDNVFEPVLRRREPAIEAVFATLSRIGTPRLTGTGSGCFVEFASLQAAQAGLALLPSELRGWVVAGAARSPLLDALDGSARKD